ncbi:MAG: hypothetical protein ACP5LB_07465 [Candidatus Bathyarchaeia archaeon]
MSCLKFLRGENIRQNGFCIVVAHENTEQTPKHGDQQQLQDELRQHAPNANQPKHAKTKCAIFQTERKFSVGYAKTVDKQ